MATTRALISRGHAAVGNEKIAAGRKLQSDPPPFRIAACAGLILWPENCLHQTKSAYLSIVYSLMAKTTTAAMAIGRHRSK
jgi:hypothetical protein